MFCCCERRFFLLVMLPVLLLLSGCDAGPVVVEDSTEEKPVSLSGMTTTVAVPTGSPYPVHWEVLLEEWKLQNKTEVKIVEYDPASLLEQVTESTNDWNVVLFPTEKLYELGAAEKLASFPEEILTSENLNWDNLFRGVRENLSQLNQKPSMVPVSAPVLVCYYRADLLEQAKLKPPETWTEYQQLLESREEWAGDLPVVEPWGPSSRVQMFLARSASYVQQPGFYSVFLDSFEGTPRMNSPEFLKSLQLAQQDIQQMPAEVLNYTPEKCRQEMMKGRAAMAIAWEYGANSTQTEEITRSDEIQIGISPLPGAALQYDRNENEWKELDQTNRAQLIASTGLGAGVLVNEEPTQMAANWSLFSFLFGQNYDAAFPAETVSPLRYTDADLPQNWVGPGLTVSEGVQYLQAVTESLDADSALVDMPLMKRDELRKALDEELDRFLKQESTPEETLQQVNQKWREILNPLDQKEVLNVYRRTLGMPLK